MVEVGPEFERVFGQVLSEAREIMAENREELETKYGIPMELIGFLIAYHLLPDEMYTYLVWWTNSEQASKQQ